jgi:c-di-GMP-binding flagellar brake protein YcgR
MGTAGPMKEQEDPCILTSSSEIECIIQDLQKMQSFVTVGMPDGKKMSSMILEVDGKSRQFVYEAGQGDDAKAVISSPRIYFYSTLRGVSVRFSVRSASRATFEGHPALRSPLPADMEYLQRREHFRTTFDKPYTATVKMPDGKPVVLDLRDMSAGGARLSSMTITSEMLPTESMVDASLDFAELGKVDVTLKVSTYLKLENQGRFTHQYGCAFYNMTPDKETKVRQLVFKLDQMKRANKLALVK